MMKKQCLNGMKYFAMKQLRFSWFIVFPYGLVQHRMCFILPTGYCANKPVAYFAMYTNLSMKVTLGSEKVVLQLQIKQR